MNYLGQTPPIKCVDGRWTLKHYVNADCLAWLRMHGVEVEHIFRCVALLRLGCWQFVVHELVDGEPNPAVMQLRSLMPYAHGIESKVGASHSFIVYFTAI